MFKNKEGKVRSGWKIALVMAVCLAITTIFSLVIAGPTTFILIAKGDLDVSTMVYTERGQQIMNQINTVMMFIQEIVFILTPVIAWKFIMKRNLSDMGLTPVKKHSKELMIGLLLGIVSITVVFVALLMTGNTMVNSWNPHFSISQLIYLVIFIFVGFAEEIFSRGFIMSVLRQTKNIAVIYIVSSILFALLHSGNSGIGIVPYINLTLVGVLFAYMFVRSGNLWMCIGYHITWNYFQGYVYGFKVSGTDSVGIITTSIGQENIFNGGAFGPEGGLFVTAVILLGFLFTKYYYRNSQYNFIASDQITESNSIEETANPNASENVANSLQ